MIKSLRVLCLSMVWPALAAGAEGRPAPLEWSEETKQFVAGGDAQKGEALAEACVRCHGLAGYSRKEEAPHLAGQRATYIYKQLYDYKTGARRHRLMNKRAGKMSAQDMADLAAWYSGQSLPLAKKLEPEDTLFIETVAAIPPPDLVHAGDPERAIPPCAGCHGPNGEGAPIDNPSLMGLQIESFVTAMEDFRSGERANDAAALMRRIADTLVDIEIETLANYYAGLEPDQ